MTGARARRARRRARLAAALTALAALALAVTVVWHAAYAGFTDSTSPSAVTVSTATLALADDDAGTALFTATDLRPGAAATRCITVSSTSAVPTTVRLYASTRTTSTLSGQLRVTVEMGTGSCAAFVSAGSPVTAALSALPTSWAGGLASWRTTAVPGEFRVYQVTYSLPASSTTGQNGTASLALTWEAQS